MTIYTVIGSAIGFVAGMLAMAICYRLASSDNEVALIRNLDKSIRAAARRYGRVPDAEAPRVLSGVQDKINAYMDARERME